GIREERRRKRRERAQLVRKLRGQRRQRERRIQRRRALGRRDPGDQRGPAVHAPGRWAFPRFLDERRRLVRVRQHERRQQQLELGHEPERQHGRRRQRRQEHQLGDELRRQRRHPDGHCERPGIERLVRLRLGRFRLLERWLVWPERFTGLCRRDLVERVWLLLQPSARNALGRQRDQQGRQWREREEPLREHGRRRRQRQGWLEWLEGLHRRGAGRERHPSMRQWRRDP